MKLRRKQYEPSDEEKRPYTIKPQELKIAWISDDTQWKISENQTEGYAEAIKVMWFEVKATYKEAKAGNTYRLGFNISLTKEAFGWHSSPVFMMAKVGDSGSYTWRRVDFNEVKAGIQTNFPSDFEISVPSWSKDTTLQFGLYEIWGGRWKGGLQIHHAFVAAQDIAFSLTC